MRLANFIDANLEPILTAWEQFAKTILPAARMDSAALRDHAEQMLRTIVEDLRTSQSTDEQRAKSLGLGPQSPTETPAQTHAVDRHLSGFSIDEMVSEYRALRASVLKLWLLGNHESGVQKAEDMIRFNEAIDQALAESVASFSLAVTDARNVLLGILGHDLRSPLTAILVSSEMLIQEPYSEDRTRRKSLGIHTSAVRASRIVEDLLDFTRSQTSGGIPVHLQQTNVAAICRDLVDETRAANPARQVQFDSAEEVIGSVDAERVGQILSNLIGNALKHGTHTTPIQVIVKQIEDQAMIEVHNEGKPIPPDVLPFIFNFMTSHPQHAEKESGRAGLGLGLFIVNEIVAAHKGKIEIKSTAKDGTSFCVKLPLLQHSAQR